MCVMDPAKRSAFFIVSNYSLLSVYRYDITETAIGSDYMRWRHLLSHLCLVDIAVAAQLLPPATVLRYSTHGT